MPKKISTNIIESLDFLEKEFEKTQGALKRDRIKTLILVKTGKYFFQSEIGKKLDRSEKTIRDWLFRYSDEGFYDYLSIKSGGNNTRTISVKVIEFIAEKVNDESTTITSYVELLALIEHELGESVLYGALYSHCRRNHKTKLKVSRKSHYKKDPNAIAFFKKPDGVI
jgi:transposase